MAIFKVYAKRIEYFVVEVEAANEDKALELAEDIELDEFEELDGLMEFEIYDVEETE